MEQFRPQMTFCPALIFQRTPYEALVAYGPQKTANILFAVAFDGRRRDHGVRAAAVHPGTIHTELARHLDPREMEKIVEQRNRQLPAEGKPSPVEDYF